MNKSTRSLIAALAALLAALALTLTGVAPASGDANEGVSGFSRTSQAQITAGEAHTCVLLTGEVWCWGANGFGQLGNGTNLQSTSPVKVTGLSGVVAVAAGWHHTCAVLSDQTARCWGQGTSGQLGNGSLANSGNPVAVSGLAGVSAIAGGRAHTCAIVGSQTRCWGLGGHGQLGHGSFTDSAVPVTVAMPNPTTALSLGYGHTCATLVDGQLRCWGINDFGQLGNPGVFGASAVPVPVSNVVGTALSSGREHLCATGFGQTRCWGYNNNGQLGNGTMGGATSSATPVSGLPGGVQSIAAGALHTCAMPGDGSVRCWGAGFAGQLGNGGFSSTPTQVPVAGLGGTPVAVTGGGDHTCALLADRSVRCWGMNANGQLGNGSTSNSPLPVTAISVPGAPTDVSARPDFASASVAFKAPVSNGRMPITSYKVTSSPGGITATGSGSPITVNGLTNGTTYTFTVQAINAVGASPASAPSNAVTPSNTPYFEINDVAVVEGNSASKLATFTVKRFGNTSGSSTVKYATANGTAVAPGDYTAKAATSLSFAAGQTSKTLTVSVKGELLVEPNETFAVNLSAPVGASIFDGSGTGTIVNDDSNAAPTFSVNDVALVEANSASTNAVFTITRNGSAAAAATVKYKTTDGTAVAPGDYTAKALTSLSFAIGQTTKTVSVAVKGDLAGEPDETFTLNLSAPTGASIVDGTGVGTILNNDSTGTTTVAVNDVSITEGDSLTKTLVFTVTRTGDVSGTSSVKYATANGSAIAPGDYTAKALTLLSFSAGQTSKTVSISIKGDAVVEPDETFTLVLSAPVGTVIGDGTGVGTIVNDD